MPRGEASPFSEKNPAAFGFSGDRRRNNKTTSFWQRTAVAIFFLAAISVISHTFGHSTEKPKTRKSKRHLLGQEKMSAQNVHIIPEQPPTLKELRKDIIGNRRAPRPFEPTAEKHRSSSENMATGQKPETTLISGLARGLTSSMRLKGIYMQPVSKRGNHLEEKFYFSKEINNLMQELSSGTKDGERTLKKVHGAPFELPAKRRPRMSKPPPLIHSRPLTILLDFYPMTRKKKFSDHAKPEKFANGKGKGLIMKLNLYPPKGWQPLKTAERKSFGWFSKEEKKKKTDLPKSCSFLGLNPLGNRITAKWKNKNGDWIHAKRVSVKYWEKANNRNGRK